MKTGICKNCGLSKEHHYIDGGDAVCSDGPRFFTDSGLARLHEHAEELYEAVNELLTISYRWPVQSTRIADQLEKLDSILKKINP